MNKKLLITFGIITCWVCNPKCYAQLSCALNGTYTIDASQPTIGNNFSSFTEATQKMDSCGISGPVVFNVVQGTYDEQFTIGHIEGSNSVNTILIQPSLLNMEVVKIMYSENADRNSNNHVIAFDSAFYVTIKGLNIEARNGAYGRAITFIGHSERIELIGNTLTSNSSTSVIIEKLKEKVSYSTIKDNLIKGGKAGIFWRKIISPYSLFGEKGKRDFDEGNSFINNKIITTVSGDYAFYCGGQHDLVVEYNYVKSLGGGVKIERSDEINLLGNRILAYMQNGMSINECGAEPEKINTITNNMISGLGDAIAGVEIGNTVNTYLIHNSILANSSNGDALRIFSSLFNDDGNLVQNNNIINRGKGTTVNIQMNRGDINYFKSMDYNNLYYNTDSALLGVFGMDTVDDNLIDWRYLTSLSYHSLSVNPFLVNDTDLHASSLDIRVPNYIPLVSVDIDSLSRSSIKPFVGASEVLHITGNCSSFSELSIDSIQDDSFKLSWIPGINSSSYYLEYGSPGFIPGGTNSTLVAGVYPDSLSSLHISDLLPNTAYELHFGEICNSGNDTVKTMIMVETDNLCPLAKDIQIENLTRDSISFILRSFNESFEIEWGLSGYEQGTGTASTVSSSFAINNLRSNTSYDVYIRTDCRGEGKNTSDWYGPITFTTVCDPSNILSGTYTIDPSLPPVGRNFTSFNMAVDALSCGVSGPVVFNVKEGIYNEQIVLKEVKGANSTNTITFQADTNNTQFAEIQYGSTLLKDNYIIEFVDASFFRIKGLKLNVIGSHPTNCRAIHMIGIGKDNIIEDNIIEGKVLAPPSIPLINTNTMAHRSIISMDCFTEGSVGVSGDMSTRLAKYDSCIIRNNTIAKGYYGIFFYSSTGIDEDKIMENFPVFKQSIGNIIENNIIKDFTCGGIRTLHQYNLKVKHNIIESSSFSHILANGIQMFGEKNEISKNMISLTMPTQSSILPIFAVCGLAYSGRDILIANNMIRIQGTSPSERTSFILGNYGYCHNIDIFNNSFLNNVDGSFGNTVFLFSSGVGSFENFTVKNNNAVVAQNGRVIEFHDPILFTNFYSNNNNFYYTSGGALGTYDGIAIPDLATWQSTTSLDSNSVSVDPLLVSLTDLHAQSVLIDGKGIPIAEVTDDIDGDIRSATAPDIGADEFTPLPCFPSEDFQAAQLYSDSIQVNWTPGSGMEFIIEYGVKGFTPGEGVITSGIIDTFYTIDGLFPNTEYDFYIRDFCNVGDTSASIGPFMIKTLCIDTDRLSGIYTVNSSVPASATNFTTMGEVASVLNNCGVKDSVIINITEGSYNEKIALGDIYGTSAVKTVTFKPDPSNINSVEITSGGSQSANYVIQFDNTHYVIIKGLSLSTGTTTYGTVLNFLGDCKNIVIDSNTISGSQGSPSGVEQAVIRNDNIGTPRYVNDITIKNNTIRDGSYGMYWYGVGAGNPEKGTVIENNRFEGFYTEGIRSYYQDSIRIEKNMIISEGTNSVIIKGINISTNEYSQIARNTLIQKAGTGIRMENGNKNLLSNNMISITGNNNAARGVSVINSKKQDVVFNSIFLNTNNIQSSCIELSGTDTATIYNNNFVNAGGGYAVMSGTSTELTTDYNNLYVTGSHIGKWNGTDITALSSWQTQSGQDVNSVSVDPMFIATDDLHARSPLINDKGILYNLITMDIDGEARSATTPDIGADEFITYSHDLWAVEILSPLDSSCGDSDMIVSVQIINMGSQSATGFTVQAELTGTVAATLSETYMGTLNSGETDTVTLSSFHAFNGGSVNIKAYINYSSDQRTENDTLRGYAYLLPSSRLSPQSAQGYFCKDHPYDTLYFPTGVDNSFSWKTAAGNVMSTTDSLVVGPLQSDTSFILSATEGCYKDGQIRIIRSETPVASFMINLQSAEATKLTVDFNAEASTGVNTYTWNFGDGQTGTGSTISHDYTANGSYDVQLIISGDCGSDTLIKTIDIRGISIEENLISRSLEVYPNPTKDKVMITFETQGSEEVLIRLNDLSGKIALQMKALDTNGNYKGELDISYLAKGVYLIEISSGTEDVRAIRKIVKE